MRIDPATLRPASALPPLSSGMVVEGYHLHPQFRVSVPDVTLRDCLVDGGAPGEQGMGVLANAPGLALEYCTLAGWSSALVAYDNYSLYRCEVTGFSDDGLKLGTGVHIVESWVHDCHPATGSHADGAQQQNLVGPAGSSIERCVVDMGPAIGNAALFLCPDLGGTGGGDILIADNFLAGGNYTLQVRDGADGRYHQRTYRVLRNTVKTGSWRYGPVVKADTVAEWSGNVLSTGQALL